MCGIFVVINKNKKKLDIRKCKKSLNELKKRGPDWSFNKTVNNNIFFGQTVLSMTGQFKKNIKLHNSKTGRFFILFNGEIYNYKKLKNKHLNKLNINIKSDTNLLVNLFEHIKINRINNLLDGMYAYVLYDSLKKKIYIGRDIQGEKSLFRYEDNNFIILSSEINAIMKFTGNLPLNFNELKTYFFSRHFMQFNKTIFKNISVISAGDLIEINLKNLREKTINRSSIHKLVDKKTYENNLKKTESQLVEELELLLKKNIKEMVPDRNFASIVSGGIDSTLVSKLLCDNFKPKKLITVDHVGKDKISNNINIFKKFFSVDITKLKIDKNLYYKFLQKSIKICQSPINSHDFVGKLFISKKINQLKCKAIFGGDGADELFGGYKTYLQKIPNSKINYSAYSSYIKNNIFNNNNISKNFKKKLDNDWKKSLNSYKFIKNKVDRNRLAMMLNDSSSQLMSVGLRGCDLMSMYHSVEPRSVFLRKEIIKFALNLPIKHKINIKNNSNFNTKIILKKLFIKHFSKKLIFKKQGFAGFPNEMVSFLGTIKNFRFIKYFSLKKFNFLITNYNKATLWKIYNTEFFLRNN